MGRGQERSILYPGCKWSHSSLCLWTGEKHLVETAAALAGRAGGWSSEVIYKFKKQQSLKCNVFSLCDGIDSGGEQIQWEHGAP